METVKIIADVGMTIVFIVAIAYIITWVGEKM